EVCQGADRSCWRWLRAGGSVPPPSGQRRTLNEHARVGGAPKHSRCGRTRGAPHPHVRRHMTFTEAAVEVLRLVGRPLHYKKITEVANAKNLFSHVGKVPDMTMSSRLATMVKKDRGDEPIIKVKPGVFGLREFSAEVLALADADYEVDVSSLPDVEVAAAAEEEEEGGEEIAEPKTGRRALPGADVFPEEEDDDEPILGKMDEPAREEGARANGGGEGEE